jgi:ligand-binding sensor protein
MEDTISYTHSVVADRAQGRLARQYKQTLIPVTRADLQGKIVLGIMIAIMIMVIL